ncbi:hypothetical protein EYF80_037801 [Liparis tanakae]|uniref:Uncharacterized protein n=1 Tax=Liparis tanakae TaxID=230148 RepID=A0A4Z2GFQ4_9TELE|nr:hypothetical protein EYF80_037801 [Liparis tanakae]
MSWVSSGLVSTGSGSVYSGLVSTDLGLFTVDWSLLIWVCLQWTGLYWIWLWSNIRFPLEPQTWSTSSHSASKGTLTPPQQEPLLEPPPALWTTETSCRT